MMLRLAGKIGNDRKTHVSCGVQVGFSKAY